MLENLIKRAANAYYNGDPIMLESEGGGLAKGFESGDAQPLYAH